jgi:hypothetical protein
MRRSWLAFTNTQGGNFCLIQGIEYQYLGKNGKNVLYLVLLSKKQICLI